MPLNWSLLVLLLFLRVMASTSKAVLNCGAFGILVDSDQGSNQTCHCPALYWPADEAAWYSGNWSGGCVPEAHPCTNVWTAFEEIGNYRPAGAVFQGTVPSTDACVKLCEYNCSCRAVGLQTQLDGSIDCYLWFGNNIHISASPLPGFIFLLRIFIPWRRSSLRTKLIIAAAAATAAAVVAVLVTYALRKRAKAKESGFGTATPDCLRVFSYKDLRAATANFSRSVGSGGFGTVFQGRLRDGSMVAVKKLHGPARRDKEFRAEVSTVGVIRHVNLVRLLGFCCEGESRLLVYELLPNGSLASALFGSVGADGPPCLDWNTRFGIAVGAARGISYLHEGCRDCIIHCDIKPDNVLLDADFRPKIADFGLAKLLDRDYSKALTTLRGTFGYLAPEWLWGDPITAKADVYSFGVTLLELLSGKRNVRRSADSEALMYPIRTAMEISRGNFMAAVDPRIRETADPEQVRRAAVAGLWCIQDEPCLRPSMKDILLLLLQSEGAVSSAMSLPPVPMSLLMFVSEPPCKALVSQWQPQSDDEDGDDGDDSAMLQRQGQVHKEETGMESV